MTARTRKATTPTSSTAKKTAAKKTTPARKPRNTATTKNTTAPSAPRLSLVKTEPARPHLPTRARAWMTDTQGYATLAARIAGHPAHPIHDWHDHRDNTATRPLRDGSHLHYTLATRTLTWQALCPMGAIHEYTLTTPSTAAAARVHTNRCTTAHADLDHLPALTPDELAAYGIHTGPTWARPDAIGDDPITETIPVLLPTPTPEPAPEPEPRALGDQLTRTRADTTETQPLSQQEIADGIAARADQDTPKGHPES